MATQAQVNKAVEAMVPKISALLQEHLDLQVQTNVLKGPELDKLVQQVVAEVRAGAAVKGPSIHPEPCDYPRPEGSALIPKHTSGLSQVAELADLQLSRVTQLLDTMDTRLHPVLRCEPPAEATNENCDRPYPDSPMLNQIFGTLEAIGRQISVANSIIDRVDVG